jgi:hypothetical protein
LFDRAFGQVWLDVQKVLQGKDKVPTLCRKINNSIVEVTPDYIVVKSELSRKVITDVYVLSEVFSKY